MCRFKYLHLAKPKLFQRIIILQIQFSPFYEILIRLLIQNCYGGGLRRGEDTNSQPIHARRIQPSIEIHNRSRVGVGKVTFSDLEVKVCKKKINRNDTLF